MNMRNMDYTENVGPRTTVQFEPLARVLIEENKYLVISLRSDGRISIAQQVATQAGSKMIHIYLKNAIEIEPDKLSDVMLVVSEAMEKLGMLTRKVAGEH